MNDRDKAVVNSIVIAPYAAALGAEITCGDLRAIDASARKILRQGPLAARLAKLALNASARVDLDSGLLIETLAQALCYSSDDKREGTTAFLEKRKPKFTGK
jgi:enoyl-CoA hydratase